jgi:hypothetical protein
MRFLLLDLVPVVETIDNYIKRLENLEKIPRALPVSIRRMRFRQEENCGFS